MESLALGANVVEDFSVASGALGQFCALYLVTTVQKLAF